MPTASAAPSPRRGWVGVVVAGLAMAVLTLLPIGWQLNRLVVWIYYEALHIYSWPGSDWISLELLAHLLNVVMTLPLGLMVRLAVPRWRWWAIGMGISILAGLAELAQWLLPLGREATLADVATNGLGGCLGALLGTWWGHRHTRRVTPRSPGQ